MPQDIDTDSLLKKLTDKAYADTVREISTNFTSDRAKIGKYVGDEEFVSAYAWFYLPTNKPKLHFLFNRLSEQTMSLIQNSPFIDYGSGPGTYTWALLDYMSTRGGFEESIVLVDTSPAMLRQARKIHAFEYSEQTIINYVSKIPAGSLNQPFLFFGNSINEMSLAQVEKIIEQQKPVAIGLIEPGTKETHDKIIKLRTHLIKMGYHIDYPCPTSSACPLENSTDNWCHQVALVSHEPEVQRKCQLTGLDRRSLPMIAQVYIKQDSHGTTSGVLNEKRNVEENECERVIFRYLGETKGAVMFQVCENESKGNTLAQIEVMKRGLSKSEIKAIKTIQPGDKVSFTVDKILSDGTKRVREFEAKQKSSANS